jgi:P-type E1-E2 ATPase
MVKEIFEDWIRGTMDARMNNDSTQVLDWESGKFRQTAWGAVKVGDVVLYRDNQPIPADAVVVGSAGRTGGFFVSTADLDGESNLKARESVAATSPLM